MKPLWDAKTSAQATSGQALGSWQAARVEIDSRKIQAGDLFVALNGERFDGHEFVAQALEKGAVAAVVSKPVLGIDPAQLLTVPDTQKALEDLGIYNRKRSQAKIVGVTGSVGKTSSKEMLKLALAAHGKTYATAGNYNNHIGTPLNLANLPADAQFGVFEMGMNHAGEISHLTRMVCPQVAIITAVEAVHLEFFDSIEGIARAKAEIFQGVPPGGSAVLPADSPFLPLLKEEAVRSGINRFCMFGKAIADCRMVSYKPVASGCKVTSTIAGKKLSYTLNALGEQWALLSVVTLAACHMLGLDVEKTATAIASFSEPEGRGRISQLPNGAFLIDDSYNASPASMRSAFAKLSEVKAQGRKFAVLGDMLELGPEARDMHEALLLSLEYKNIDQVFTAGSLMKYLHDALPSAMRGAHMAHAMELLPALKKTLRAGDVVLVKGSHGSHMHALAAALKEYSHWGTQHAV